MSHDLTSYVNSQNQEVVVSNADFSVNSKILVYNYMTRNGYSKFIYPNTNPDEFTKQYDSYCSYDIFMNMVLDRANVPYQPHTTVYFNKPKWSTSIFDCLQSKSSKQVLLVRLVNKEDEDEDEDEENEYTNSEY